MDQVIKYQFNRMQDFLSMKEFVFKTFIKKSEEIFKMYIDKKEDSFRKPVANLNFEG